MPASSLRPRCRAQQLEAPLLHREDRSARIEVARVCAVAANDRVVAADVAHRIRGVVLLALSVLLTRPGPDRVHPRMRSVREVYRNRNVQTLPRQLCQSERKKSAGIPDSRDAKTVYRAY